MNRFSLMLAAGAFALAANADTPHIRANTAASRLDGWWTVRHAEKVAAVADASVKKDVVFLGDELTQDWETTGAGALASHFAGDRTMFNLGFAGDCTENVLWRIQNGELGSPKAVFLMVGGNNAAIYAEREEAEGRTYLGVRAIIDELVESVGASKVVVQAVLPRGLDETDPVRPRNDRLNIDVRAYAQKKGCAWVDMSDLFLENDHHTLKTSLFNDDLVTLNAAGYEVWAQAVAPFVAAATGGSAMPADLVATARPAIDCIAAFPTSTNAVMPQYFWQKYEDDLGLIGESGRSFDLVLLGDSLTQKWMEGNSASSMNGLASSVLNLGRTGDFVENLHWRLKGGCIDGYTTKFFNLLIGTNNTIQKSPSDSPEDIATGVKAVLDLVLEKHPESKVLLMPIIPYGYTNAQNNAKGAAQYANNEAANEIIKTYADGQRVILVDVRSQFLNADGTYKGEMYLQGNGDYPDMFLHLTTKAYEEILAPAIKGAMATAGASSVALPSIGSAASQVNGTSATISISGVTKGTDANGAAASSYSVLAKLDTDAEATVLTAQTGATASFSFADLSDGWHSCAVTVTSDGTVKSFTKRVKFLVDSQANAVGWKVAPMTVDGSAIRGDGTKVFAIAKGGDTAGGVTFASSSDPSNASLETTPAKAGGDGWGLGVNNNIINAFWWWNMSGTSTDVTFKLKGLTSGRKYIVQIVASHYHNSSGITVSAGDIAPVAANDSNDYKYGAVITRVFEASGTTENVVVNFSGSSSKFEVKAIQLRELGEGSGEGGGGATVVAPSIGSVSATTNNNAATISLSNVVMGTDDEGAAASSYSIAYSLNGASAVTALSNQTGATVSFSIVNLADGDYACVVTIATDKGKTSAAKSVSFRIGTPPPPVVAPSIGLAAASVVSSNATITLSDIVLGTDDEGAAASSYSVSYALNGGTAVAALANQTTDTASFSIENLADGSYACAVTVTTDKGKTATKSVSFAVSTSGGGGEIVAEGWTVETLSASDETMLQTAGTLLYAYRGASTDRTLGGVTFQAGADLSSANISFNPTFNNADENAGSSSLLGTAWNFGVDTGMGEIHLTLSGLTTGHAYLLQILARNSFGNPSITIGDLPAVSIQNGNGSSGATVYGSFAAEAASHVVTFKMGGSGAARLVAAVQVRDLGEGGGGGGDDPVDPTTPVCMLTIPEKTGLQLQSVTTNGVAVTAVGGSYSIVSNTQVTVTFAAASGFEITGGNPVVFTLSGDKTFVDADYPTVQATSGGGGGGSVETGWTGGAATANGSFFSTDGTLLYAYAVSSVTVNGIAFAADADLNTADTTVQPDLAQTDGNSGSEGVAGDFGTMLKNSWEWANSTSTLTITLKNLTIGKRYLAQFFAHNQWSGALIGAGELTPMAMRETNKYGASLVYVFEAIANSESVVLKYSGDGGWRALNAVQVRELEGESPYVDPEGNMAEGCVLRISEILPKPTDARTLNGMEGMDVNGLESGWVEVENTSDKWADLADYRFIRVNRGKKTDPAGYGNFPSRLVPPHGRAIFYTSERYSNSKDKTVSAFAEGTFDGKPMIFENYGDILVWGDKVNPKKSPYVRLYYAPVSNASNIVSVVDTVVIPSDLPEGWSIIVGDAAEGEGTRRWMCPTPTRGAENTATTGLVRIGPNVGPLYEKSGQKKTDLVSEFAAPVPPAVPGEDYSVTLPINGVMNPDGTFTPRAADQIQSIKFVYRKDLDDATLVTNEVSLATKTTDANWGDRYTATIPSSYFPAAGHLMQWKVLITDGEGVEWTSPSFNNKDDGYEWYGTIVEPDSDTQMSATLPTWHMFASGNHLTQMDVDADKQNLSLVPYNARVAIYDSSTSNYYDYVRIDLRGNTSAGFTKKGHGLRFAKSHPMTMTDAVTGETIEEIRKTSLISEFADPSYMRQMIAFWLWRKMGNLVPFDFPVRCNLNGEFYQLAFNSERFTDELIEDVYGLDKFGYGYKNVGTLRSGSGTTAGGIEKKTPDDEDESNITVLQNELRSKITAAQQVSSSPDGGSTGLDNVALTKFVVQKFDLPAWLNYLASARITQEMDDVWANVCAYYDNPAMLQGARGTGTWMPLGYDFNLSFGQYYRDNGVGGNGLFATNDWFKSHPFYGGSRVRCYSSSSMSTTINYGNDGFEAVWQSAKFRRLYLRRLRTLMDQELKAPGTPESEVPFMAKMREMADLMRADAASDTARWPNNGTDSNIDVWSSRPASMDAGIQDIWDNYVVPRREHLYVTHSVTNTAKAVGYGSRLNAGIPEAQSPIETLAPNITADLSGLADGVVVISNGNNEVVDMSGWVLKTAVEWTLPAGTVCDAQDAIYVVADRRAYVAAHADELADQVIVGNATFSDTAVLQIFAADGTTQVLTTEPDEGDPDQANLRFHTIYGSTLNGGGDLGEFIVITNVSANAVNLDGVEISCGKAGSAPKCRIVLGNVDLPGYGSIRLDQADYANVGWTKITNGSIAMKIVDKTGATVQIGELTFGLCDPRTDEGGYALQAKRFDNETPLADSADDWTAVFVEAAAPDAPVVGGGGGGAAPIAVGASSVTINITNARAGFVYGYRKSTTLAGLKDAPIVYQDVPAGVDGDLLIEVPREDGETTCFYQIAVKY